MALKLNIRPDLEGEIDALLPKSQARSKTDYINRAIETYNRLLRRQIEVGKLSAYFNTYREEAKDILHDFSTLRRF